MKMKILTLAAALGAFSFVATAETVTITTAGTLQSLVSDMDATELTVSGTVNAADLYWAADNMPSLTTLNLSGATIAAYQGDMLKGRVEYAAATIPVGAFAGTKLTAVTLPTAGTVNVAEAAFAGTNLTTLTIPANVAAVGMGAFSSCTKLTKLTLNATTVFGASAFADCTALTTVNLNGATTIADGAFNGCTALTTITGTDKLTAIGARAFLNCRSLQAFTFGKNLGSIGASAFQHTGLEDANLVNCGGLTRVGALVFANDAALVSVTFDADAPTDIAEGAFMDCSALQQIVLPTTMTRLSDYVLKGTTAAVGHDVLPAMVDSIGAYALKDNKAITNLTLPDNVSYIGDGAMENMTGLEKISALTYEAAPALGRDVWAGVDQPSVKLEVPSDVVDEFKNADQWQNFDIKGITGVDTGVADIVADSGVSARFVGTDLQVRSTGVELDNVALYNAAGILLMSISPYAEDVTIDTAGFSTRLFIVSVKLADGRSAALKLAR